MFAYREKLKLEPGAPACTAFTNARTAPGMMVNCHWHDAYELLLVRRGRCVQRVGMRELTLGPGALSVIAPGDIHSTCALERCEIDVVQCGPDAPGAALPSLIWERPALDAAQLAGRFDNLKAAAGRADAAARLILSGGIRELAGQLMRLLPDSGGAPPHRLAQAVARCLDEGGDTRLAAVAARLGYAPEHLSRRFHEETGATYREYAERVRMGRALTLLRRGGLSSGELAAQLGYSGAASFARAFKRAYGMSPARYMSRRAPTEPLPGAERTGIKSGGKTDMDMIQRMHSTELYLPDDEALMREQAACLELQCDYNQTRPSQPERRRELLERMFAEVGEGCYIEPPLHANWAGRFVHLGRNVYANFCLTLVDDAPIYIGDYTMIGPNVTIATGAHPISPELRQRNYQYNVSVRIGRACWLGAGVIVLPGVTIGDGSVIGAGSVVTRDIPAGVVAVGNPCRVVRRIGEQDMTTYFHGRPVPAELLARG